MEQEKDPKNLSALTPDDYQLEQNYPNPFNPSTVIRYALPKAGHVTLKVYNMLGQEVASLVDEFQDAGYKAVRLDAEELPTGAYVCRLLTIAKSISSKMLLIR